MRFCDIIGRGFLLSLLQEIGSLYDCIASDNPLSVVRRLPILMIVQHQKFPTDIYGVVYEPTFFAFLHQPEESIKEISFCWT